MTNYVKGLNKDNLKEFPEYTQIYEIKNKICEKIKEFVIEEIEKADMVELENLYLNIIELSRVVILRSDTISSEDGAQEVLQKSTDVYPEIFQKSRSNNTQQTKIFEDKA